MQRKQLIHLLVWSSFICLFFFYSQYGITKGYSVLRNKFTFIDVAVYLVFSLCFSLQYLSNMRLVRFIALACTFITFTIFICYLKVTGLGGTFNSGLGFEVSDANLLLIESSRSGAVWDVVLSYWRPISYATAQSIVFVLVIYAVSAFIKLKIQRVTLSVAPIIAISIIYFFLGSGAAVDKMPIVVKVPMQFAFASNLNIYKGERDGVKLPLINKEKHFPMIIYIVDESIRGDLLGVNGFKYDTTPFLSAYSGTLLNYGVGVSSGNCSASSNIFLQTGVIPKSDTLANIGYELFTKPSIFQYAKNAGYKTVLVDGQLKGSSLQNYMSTLDFKYIDEYLQIRVMHDNPPRYLIDMYIADEVAHRVNTNSPTFFYVQKSGAHFPVGLTYPASERYYSPVANSGTEETRDAFRNSYYNSIRWNVDRFFKKLLGQIGLSDALIVYTSDHAINLLDDGGRTGYCSSTVYPSEVKVPISLIATGKSQKIVQSIAGPNLTVNRNKMSHFQLYPTLLNAMGYNRLNVREMYGLSLFDEQKGNLVRFSIGDLCPGRDTARIVTYRD